MFSSTTRETILLTTLFVNNTANLLAIIDVERRIILAEKFTIQL